MFFLFCVFISILITTSMNSLLRNNKTSLNFKLQNIFEAQGKRPLLLVIEQGKFETCV
jgi:hypothetical protein